MRTKKDRSLISFLTAAIAVSFLSTLGLTNLGSALPYLAAVIAIIWLYIFHLINTAKKRKLTKTEYVASITTILLFLNPVWSAWKETSLWLAFILALTPAGAILTLTVNSDEKSWQYLRSIVIFLISILAAAILLEFFRTGKRGDAWLPDANVAAAICNTGSFIILGALARTKPIKSSIMLTLILILVITGSLATFSRAGNAWLFTGLILIPILCSFINTKQARRLILISFTAITISISVIYFGPVEPVQRSAINTETDPATYARLLLWKSALEIYKEAPLLGNGLGTFKLIYPEFRSKEESQSSGDLAHNDYLQILAEGGPALLIAFLALGIAAFHALYENIKLAKKQEEKKQNMHIEAISLGVATGGLFIHASVNFVFYIPPLALLSGILIGRSMFYKATNTTPLSRHKVSRSTITGYSICTTLSLVFLGSQAYANITLNSDAAFSSAEDMSSTTYQKALALNYINPLASQPYYYLIRAHATSADNWGNSPLASHGAIEALKDTRKLLQVKKRDCAAQTMQAYLLYKYRNMPAAKEESDSLLNPTELLKEVIRQDPTCFPAYRELANIHRLENDPLKALTVLNKGFEWLHIPIKIPHEWRFDFIYDLAITKEEVGETNETRFILIYLLELAPSHEKAIKKLAELDNKNHTGH